MFARFTSHYPKIGLVHSTDSHVSQERNNFKGKVYLHFSIVNSDRFKSNCSIRYIFYLKKCLLITTAAFTPPASPQMRTWIPKCPEQFGVAQLKKINPWISYSCPLPGEMCPRFANTRSAVSGRECASQLFQQVLAVWSVWIFL